MISRIDVYDGMEELGVDLSYTGYESCITGNLNRHYSITNDDDRFIDRALQIFGQLSFH